MFDIFAINLIDCRLLLEVKTVMCRFVPAGPDNGCTALNGLNLNSGMDLMQRHCQHCWQVACTALNASQDAI
jgi:hypothetical protein